MRADPEGQFEALVVAYRLRDLELCASYFSEDCEYAIYVPAETLAFGGQVIGRAAILLRHQMVDREFELLEYQARAILVAGEKVRTQIVFAFRHRATGEEIDGVMRIEALVANGKISTWHEFHDADRIQAFVRLCNAKASTTRQSENDGEPLVSL